MSRQATKPNQKNQTHMSKPVVRNPDGNIFAVIGATSSALRRAGLKEKLKEFEERWQAESKNPDSDYHSMLRLCMQFVEIELEEEEEEEQDWDCEEEDEEDCE